MNGRVTVDRGAFHEIVAAGNQLLEAANDRWDQTSMLRVYDRWEEARARLTGLASGLPQCDKGTNGGQSEYPYNIYVDVEQLAILIASDCDVTADSSQIEGVIVALDRLGLMKEGSA